MMKKVILILIAVISIGLTSCQKDEFHEPVNNETNLERAINGYGGESYIPSGAIVKERFMVSTLTNHERAVISYGKNLIPSFVIIPEENAKGLFGPYCTNPNNTNEFITRVVPNGGGDPQFWDCYAGGNCYLLQGGQVEADSICCGWDKFIGNVTGDGIDLVVTTEAQSRDL